MRPLLELAAIAAIFRASEAARCSAVAAVVSAPIVSAAVVSAINRWCPVTRGPEPARAGVRPVTGRPSVTRAGARRHVGDNTWSTTDEDTAGCSIITGLENGAQYEFGIAAQLSGATLFSENVTQTPRSRLPDSFLEYNHYFPGLSLFTTQSAMDDWLRMNGIDPLKLTLSGQPVKVWDASAPDGLYQVPSQRQALLMRFADDTFRPRASS